MIQFALKKSKLSRFLFEYGFLMLAFISIIALLSTFSIAISEFILTTKIIAFAGIVIFYLFLYVIIQTIQKNQLVEIIEVPTRNFSQQIFETDVEEKLVVLEEAGMFFGASLKKVDMLRLISSRIAEIIPYTTCAFFQYNNANKFTVPFATGRNSRLIESISLECGQGIAGKTFLSGEIEYDKNLELDKIWLDNDFLVGLKSSMAIPLFQEGEVFCVLVLFSDKRNDFGDDLKVLAETVGDRITPLIISSIAFEKNLSNALTDSLTNLPNERAFYLILENQVAEAQRFLDRRSLTVLAIDIQNFTEINEKYGHTIGDCILAFSAEQIKQQVRGMDFLARTVNDEFLVILPTATDEITKQIIDRIKKSFGETPFEILDNEKCFIELNFGSASFQNDGDTANKLLQTAIIRKQQTKPGGNNSVVFFPKQYAN